MAQLTDADQELIARYKIYLSEWTDRALNKFIQGRIAHHNEPFETQDFRKEIDNELLDIVAYQFGDWLTKNK